MEGKGERKLKPMKSPSLLQIGTMILFTERVVRVTKVQSWQWELLCLPSQLGSGVVVPGYPEEEGFSYDKTPCLLCSSVTICDNKQRQPFTA